MNIFVYSDESGVFDKAHNDWFVFGGVIFLSKDDKDSYARKYIHAERCIRATTKVDKSFEIKATSVTNAHKSKLYRALNNCYKFAAIVDQRKVHDEIYADKKSKQRYLDYAYKIAIKRAFISLINMGKIVPGQVENLYFYVDEHTTATNGRYELREGLEQEFKIGTFNYRFETFYPPIFPCLHSVELEFRNSAVTTLVRAADIVANKVFYLTQNRITLKAGTNYLFPTYLP